MVDIGAEFWNGFLRIYRHLRSEGFLIYEFGRMCKATGNGLDSGLDEELTLRLRVEVGIEWNPQALPDPPVSRVALDCVEFFARRVRKPKGREWHNSPGLFASHFDYLPPYSREVGLREYSELVNGLLRVHSHPFQLVDGRVVRRGEPEFEAFINRRVIESGDDALDSLIEQARSAFWSVNPDQRRLAVERAWDAFERMKTLADPKKKTGISVLLDRASTSPAVRDVLERECGELTRIGNDFQIRHFEVGTAALEDGPDLDYFFFRLYSLITRLLPYAREG